jgi:hypothetical protein
MASQNTTVQTSNQLHVTSEVAKIFIYNNRYENVKLFNAGGAPVTFLAGTLVGRVSASGKVIPLVAAAADNSQFPVGILAQDYTVAAGATIDAVMCISGDVDSAKVVYNGAETGDTLVSGRMLKDRIKSDTLGINLIITTEMTGYDN